MRKARPIGDMPEKNPPTFWGSLGEKGSLTQFMHIHAARFPNRKKESNQAITCVCSLVLRLPCGSVLVTTMFNVASWLQDTKRTG